METKIIVYLYPYIDTYNYTFVVTFILLINCLKTQFPVGTGKVENVSSVSPACRKRRLNGAVSRNNRIKRVAPGRCMDGHVKEPYEMSMALGARP